MTVFHHRAFRQIILKLKISSEHLKFKIEKDPVLTVLPFRYPHTFHQAWNLLQGQVGQEHAAVYPHA